MSELVQYLTLNKQGRDFIIGDIHGHKKRFLKALESVGFDKSRDRLFCTGDLIDKGKHNLFILDSLREDWFFAIRGNHEQMLINRFEFPLVKPGWGSRIQTRFEAEDQHQRGGGKWFGRLWNDLAKQRIYQNLSALPYAITLQTEFGDIGLVHAEVPERFESWNEFLKNLINDSDVRDDAVWNRYAIESVYHANKGEYWEAEFQDAPRFIKDIILTVHGHTMSHEPVVHGNQVWIDTAYRTGELTILEVSQLAEMVEKEQ